MRPLFCLPQPVWSVLLRVIGHYWGLLGVFALIASAVVRLSPRMLEALQLPLGPWHWLVLLVFTPYMAYAEGYKGFHLNFAPRVVVRAIHLRESASPLHALLAPLFCMGFIHATRRRQLVSLLVTSAIVVLVLVVSHAPQPWRGIIDTGVITGLVLGLVSLLWHWLRFALHGIKPDIAPDLPGHPLS